MPVRRDTKTGRWFFRTTIEFQDGSKRRLFGTPGKSGPYHDLPNSKVGAIEAEHRAIATAMNGEKPKAKEVKTIRQLAPAFLDKYKPDQKGSERREKRRIMSTHLLPVFGDLTIEQLTQQHIDDYSRSELERIGPRGTPITIKTVNNQLAVLSTMIKYVTGERSKLRFKLDGMDGEIYAVDPYDVDALLAIATNETDRAIVLLAAEEGLRAGEIRGLQRADIRGGSLTIRRALDKRTNAIVPPKHNKSRTVPVSDRLASVLAKLPRTGLWVVADSDGAPLGYEQLLDRTNALYLAAGVPRPPKPLHCLRHTFGTVMAKVVPLPVLCDLMGHADIQTTMRYVDVGEDQKRAAFAALAVAWQKTYSSRDAGS